MRVNGNPAFPSGRDEVARRTGLNLVAAGEDRMLLGTIARKVWKKAIDEGVVFENPNLISIPKVSRLAAGNGRAHIERGGARLIVGLAVSADAAVLKLVAPDRPVIGCPGDSKNEGGQTMSIFTSSLPRLCLDPKNEGGKLAKWLETAKYGLKTLGLTKEVIDAATIAYAAFKFLF